MGSVASLLERYHGFALIEPRFARLIKGSHVRFERVGSFQDLYGQRAPYYINYHELITSLPEASLYMMEAIKARIAPKYYQEFLELSSDATFSWRNAFLSKALE
ncbi:MULTISPECIES: hypothetical protein [Larsenimonas]|uniref:Uncharacterized protein n=1 Tax=Larsenimonas suaedae TaxID=1851019 RepID=A0ABU1GSI3_9GAMM|nr:MULTISPECIES: hypothetical protein [Larsenimonas]MCM2972265.1 hypothetical protein [Larsenimonas suaedae]MCM5704171.1 hypothetical protein [Larsenimonas salina]MDR5894939.1 hypothetical protein [Larsenimonas suaedae]